MTPPSTNPDRTCAIKRRHWADPVEIKPGVFSVMEGSGPKATSRDFAIVKLSNGHGWWRVLGRVNRVTYSYVSMETFYNDSGRTWTMSGPEKIAPECVAKLIEIAKEHF